MRLLYLSHRLPCPPHKGEKIRALNVLAFLARKHQIHLASLVDDGQDLRHISTLKPYLQTFHFCRLRPTLDKALALPAVCGSQSITSHYFHSRSLQRMVDEVIERENIEGIFCSSSAMAEYVFRSIHAEKLRSLPKIMDMIDVDSVKWRHYANESGPLSAWLYRRESRCLAALEERIAREFDQILLVTEAERSSCPNGMDQSRISVMSNGVNLEYFSATHQLGRASAEPILLFTGVMNYRPNVDGICWFAESILPLIKTAVPDVRLFVVGNRPTRAVRALGKIEGVTVTGFVPDVRKYLASAVVCIAPLRIARGIQNKILEAMAASRPVVATTEAFEGLEAEPEREILIGRDGPEFAGQVIGLLRDRARAAQIGLNARACVERGYSWSGALGLLDDLLQHGEMGAMSPKVKVTMQRCAVGGVP